MVKHSFDCLFSFAKPPKIRTVEGLSAVVVVIQCEDRLCSQTRPDINFAIPGYSLFRHYTTSKKKIKVFPVRARSYGQTRFCAALSSQPKSRKRRRRKAFRRFVLPSSGYCRGALKRSSLDRSAPDSENTPPACGRRIYYTSFFSGLQGKNVSPAHSPRAAFRASTRSVFSQATPRSSRPMWP